MSPGQLAQLACVLEVTARKPGNVHRSRDFDDAHYLDFILSASAIAGPLDLAPGSPLGASIDRAVEATRRLVATNTNLGMILLLAPLATVPIGRDLREGLAEVLERTTVEDAALAYRAIRLATPGGLGEAAEQDVSGEPTINLRDAMRLAAGRDLVARQYETGFADVFDRALPRLRRGIARGWPLETAIVDAYLDSLAHRPDTLIARKRGEATALEASSRAARVLELGWPDTPKGMGEIAALDDWLRLDGHARNPGATADLITAALFAALRDGTIRLPIGGRWSVVSEEGRKSEFPDHRPLATSRGPPAVPGSRYKVRVTKDYLVFCSGHFITYHGDQCERVHGHNYRTSVEVEDDLDVNHYVFDFIALKDLTRAIVDELDHRMLLPTRSDLIRLEDDGPNWRVRYKDRHWSFPRDECALVPIANTTAELLADHIASRLRQEFAARGLPTPRVLRVEVEESFGQSAEVEWRRDG